MLRAFVFMLLANSVFAATQIIVPDVKVYDNKQNGFQIKQSDDGYDLSVQNDGSSRVESVREITPGELSVDGLYKHEFDNKLQLAVKYNAGIKGYLANYKIRPIAKLNNPETTTTHRSPTTTRRQYATIPPTKPIQTSCLKSLAGCG